MILHDSHAVHFRDPVGPVPAGGSIRLRLFCDEAQAVTLRTWSFVEDRLGMSPVGEGLFEAVVAMPESPMLFWYDFIVHKDGYDVRYGNALDQLGGEGAQYSGQPPSYQVTVFDPAFDTPSYLKTGIIYQLFPDRFYPDGSEMKGRITKVRKAHPDAAFHSCWDERPTLDIDPANGDNRALDFFGGTLEGIRQKLGYLKAMGITVIYLNPVFRARSNHRYDTGSYEEIDPILGDDAAFDSLVAAAKSMGMEIILDGVFSHTGADSQYFNLFGRYDSLGAYQSMESPYYSWYRFDVFPDQYNAWWGIYTLPAVEKDNKDYQHYLLNPVDGVLPRWIRLGAAGWRLDVADELPVPMLRRIREAVKGENPGAAIIGEVWEDASNKVSYGVARSYCLGDTIDTVMNYPLRRAVIDFLTGVMDAYQLRRVILHQREVYPAPFYYTMMNLLGSHDRVRILNAMAGYDREGAVQLPREESMAVVLSKEEKDLAKMRHLQAVKLLCALPGAPSIYYGDEIGMEGMADPWNRGSMDWTNGDTLHLSNVMALLAERQKNRVLQTGFLDVESTNSDTLIIHRFAKHGKDVFGDDLVQKDTRVRISRIL